MIYIKSLSCGGVYLQRMKHLLALLSLLAASTSALAAMPNGAVPIIPSGIGPSIISNREITVDGVRLHYIVSGQGEPVLLIPGWPEFSYAWHKVAPLLVAQGRQVYVLDPRGFGDSERTAAGYDLDTGAEDMHAFIKGVGLARAGGIDIVAHDVGGWLAYTHASVHPEDVRRLVMIESGIPGTSPPAATPDATGNIKTWHFAFNRLDSLPELLVSGHERAYLTWLFQNKSLRPSVFDAATIDAYVRNFASPGVAHAGFEYYRQAFSKDQLARTRARYARKLAMPVFGIGGEGGLGMGMYQSMKPAGTDVTGTELIGCGHYLPEECPVELTDAIIGFWRAKPVTPSNR